MTKLAEFKYQHQPLRQKSGYSIQELLISLVIGSIILMAVMASYLQNRNVYETQRSHNETLQNSRTALDQLSRDMRTAGYGMPLTRYDISDWVTWINGIDSNPYVIDGGGIIPDQVYTLAAYGSPIAEMTSSNTPGATTFPISALTTPLPIDNESHFLIFVGQVELARVISAGDSSLTVSTHPYESKGLKHRYGPGAPIELINTVHYKIAYDQTTPYLSREDSLQEYQNQLMRMCAGNIENLQITRLDDFIDIDIVARSMGQHLRHIDPDKGDHWIRQTLSSQVISRNLGTSRFGVAQSGGPR